MYSMICILEVIEEAYETLLTLYLTSVMCVLDNLRLEMTEEA